MFRLSAFWAAAVLLTTIAHGEVVELTPTNFHEVVDGSANVLLEFYAPWCGHCKKLAPEYEILGSQFTKEKDGVIIAKVDAQAHQALAAMYGVQGYPTLKWMPKGKKLPGEAEAVNAPRDAEGLGDFVSEKAGIKRRDGPKAPSSVMDLTSQTFDSIALDPKKHVLVEFFAPWCGHCKKLTPVYEKLGAAFAAEESVVIAKVDATEEKELASLYEVSGFPTIKFFPTESSDPETYSGARTLDAFVKFINDKAGTFRTTDGGLTPEAGRLEALDQVLKSLFAAPPAELASNLEEAATTAGYTSEEHKAAVGHYVRIAKKVAERGSEYLEAELKRLQGMLSNSDSLSPQKRTLFMVRSNILKSFIEAGVGKTVVVESVEVASRETAEL